jgi:hypothetical protein
MDDEDGRRRARAEQGWLTRQNAPGQVILWSTRQLLRATAEHGGWIARGLPWKAVYEQMRAFDDGLRPLVNI